MSGSRSCNGCKHALFQDEVRSRYTVENTTFHCMKWAHPNDGFDRFFGHDGRLDHAKDCTSFDKGDPIELDVNGENEPQLSDAEKERLAVFRAGKHQPLEPEKLEEAVSAPVQDRYIGHEGFGEF